MNNLEYVAVQNNALGSLALWKFVKEYYNVKYKKEGPIIHLTMIVLPMVYNQDIVKSIYNRNLKGGLIRAIAEKPSLTVGLQKRMISMSNQTFKSLNIAFASRLLDYDNETAQILPNRISMPIKVDNDDVKQILSASKRLGYWFAESSLDHIYALLKVRF